MTRDEFRQSDQTPLGRLGARSLSPSLSLGATLQSRYPASPSGAAGVSDFAGHRKPTRLSRLRLGPPGATSCLA
jgi:hypothetical protein